jgi:uncharacterized protein
MEIDESKDTSGDSRDGNTQAENTLGALIRIASRLESTPAMQPDDSHPGRRRRLMEVVAMVAVVLAAGAVGVALWGPTKASANAVPAKVLPKPETCTGSVPKLTVQGTGVANGTPNMLTLASEVDVTGATAQASLAADNAQTAGVEHALLTDGVAAKNIQTTNLSIQPNYTTVDNRTVLTGYSVSNTINTNFYAPFANAGKAIDDITAIAGNDVRIDSLSFSFADPRVLEDQARTNAVTQAVSHAQSMASAAGEQLGPICSVTDNSAVQPYYMQQSVGLFAAANAPAAGTPLSAGSQQETDQVTVVYALKTPAAGA